MKKYFFVLILFVFVSFQKINDPGCDQAQLFQKANFQVGVAVNMEKLFKNEKYRSIINSQFNSITAEKIMKPSLIHPQKDVFDFSETDKLIEYCKNSNKRLHGHTLVWHREVPEWMEHFKGNRTEWDQLLKEHIQTIINHCKGYIKSWDVINEAFNDDGSLRETIWLKNIGETYIEKCFNYAREADPNALLFYNDYNLESKSQKLDAVLKFLQNLRSKGVKIDGIGMQMHISISFPYINDINQAAMKVEEKGYLVHYSEVTISLAMSDKLFVTHKQLLKFQKTRMKEVVLGYMQLKNEDRFGITIWGVSDGDTWRKDKPLLFDSEYKIKPAYCGFLEALSE